MTELLFKDAADFVSAVRLANDPAARGRLQFWVDFFGPQKTLISITAEDVEDGLAALRQRGKHKVIPSRDGGAPRAVLSGEPLSNASLNRYLSSLGGVFRCLKDHGKLRRSFKSPMQGFGRLPENNGRTVSISADGVHRLIDAARLSRNPKLAAWVATAATTGWRSGNLATLAWGDVDLERGLIDTSRTKNGKPHRAVLLPWVVSELRRIMPEGPHPTDPVFGPGNKTKALQTALRLAGLPDDWTPHHMRHIAASVLAQSGASVPLIMSALNHKSPSMALRYSHLNTQATQAAMQSAWRQ